MIRVTSKYEVPRTAIFDDQGRDCCCGLLALVNVLRTGDSNNFLHWLMKPAQVALNLGTPPGSPTRSSSEFEQVQYPVSHHSGNSWAQHEQLPLHYMANEDTTRRRVRGIDGGEGKLGGFHSEAYQSHSPFDDQGKDVYSKSGPYRTPLTGGRPRKTYTPPPTNLVRY